MAAWAGRRQRRRPGEPGHPLPAADNKFKGKVIAVNGLVASIEKDFMDEMVVQLASPNEFMNTAATLKKSQAAQAAALTMGQAITVVCKGNGRILGMPMLRDCVIR